jgi:hypothetical protein
MPQLRRRQWPAVVDNERSPNLAHQAPSARQGWIKSGQSSSAARRGAKKPPAFSSHHDPIHLRVQFLLLCHCAITALQPASKTALAKPDFAAVSLR